MKDRQALAGNGVIVVSVKQIAEFVDSERIRRGLSKTRFAKQCGAQSLFQLSKALSGASKNSHMNTVLEWMPNANLRLTIGDTDINTVAQLCQVLEGARLAQGLTMAESRRRNVYAWQRISQIARGITPEADVAILGVISASAYVGMPMRLKTRPKQSKRLQRYLALGIAPEHASKTTA